LKSPVDVDIDRDIDGEQRWCVAGTTVSTVTKTIASLMKIMRWHDYE
jgi:hypothetical protein